MSTLLTCAYRLMPGVYGKVIPSATDEAYASCAARRYQHWGDLVPAVRQINGGRLRVGTRGPPDSWSTDLVADVCRDRVGITEARVAGGIRIGCDGTRPCVDRASVVGNRRAEGGVASVGPYDGGLGGPIHETDVIDDELLLEIVVGGCLRVRRGGAHLDGFGKARPALWQLDVKDVVGLDAGLPWVVVRGRGQGVEGDADGPVRGDPDRREEGVAIGDLRDHAEVRPGEAVARDGSLDVTAAVAAGEIAPDDVDLGAARIRCRVREAIDARAHARHPIEVIDDVEGRASQGIVHHRGNGDWRAERLPAVFRGGDHLDGCGVGRVLVLRPEGFHRSIGCDGHLPGLTETLADVVIGPAHLHRVGPAQSAVARVREGQRHVTVAGAVGAKDGPEDVDPTVEGAARVLVVDRQPLVVVEVGLGNRGHLDRGLPGRAVVEGARDAGCLAEMQVRIHGILEAGVIDHRPAAIAELPIGALPWSVVEAGIAAGCAAGRTGKNAAGPAFAVDRAVIA